jgi:CO dehydrogenase maturation factor
VRGVVGELGKARPDDVTILDTEASIEHMTRGTVRTSDAVLLVTEPYFRSLETTGRLAPLAHELGIPHVWAVANKVRTADDEAAVREYCARHGVELLAVVPFDSLITEADNAGRAALDYSPGSPAMIAAAGLARILMQRLATAGTNGSRNPAAPDGPTKPGGGA